MPICSFGGAFCPKGPGAAGASDIVKQHEAIYHGKVRSATHKRGARPVVVPFLPHPFKEAADYKGARIEQALHNPRSNSSAETKRRRNNRENAYHLERRRRGY